MLADKLEWVFSFKERERKKARDLPPGAMALWKENGKKGEQVANTSESWQFWDVSSQASEEWPNKGCSLAPSTGHEWPGSSTHICFSHGMGGKYKLPVTPQWIQRCYHWRLSVSCTHIIFTWESLVASSHVHIPSISIKLWVFVLHLMFPKVS